MINREPGYYRDLLNSLLEQDDEFRPIGNLAAADRRLTRLFRGIRPARKIAVVRQNGIMSINADINSSRHIPLQGETLDAVFSITMSVWMSTDDSSKVGVDGITFTIVPSDMDEGKLIPWETDVAIAALNTCLGTNMPASAIEDQETDFDHRDPDHSSAVYYLNPENLPSEWQHIRQWMLDQRANGTLEDAVGPDRTVTVKA